MSVSKLRQILFALILAVIAVAGWYVMVTPGLRPVVINAYDPPQIWAEARVHDLGTVETDSKATYTFLLYNLGGKHLRIRDVETTCGCTVAHISRRVIAPGSFARLEAALDTSIKMGPTRKMITVKSNDPQRPELKLFLDAVVVNSRPAPHGEMRLKARDRLVLFKGSCAQCHATKGMGKSGKDLFLADCAMCHGQQAQGHGASGPSLLEKNFSDEAVQTHARRVIAEGSPHTPQMPPFSQAKGGPLTEGQIDSLVAFLQYQHMLKEAGKLEAGEKPDTEDEAAYQEALEHPH